MALETLKNVSEINGVKLITNEDRPKKENGDVDWAAFDELRAKFPICVDHNANMVSFKIQSGPIKEDGMNGCQVADMIAVAKHIIEELNKIFPCRENAMTITKLDEALMWQEKRTKDRELRNVEGRSEA